MTNDICCHPDPLVAFDEALRLHRDLAVATDAWLALDAAMLCAIGHDPAAVALWEEMREGVEWALHADEDLDAAATAWTALLPDLGLALAG